jgi:hypothetical protein
MKTLILALSLLAVQSASALTRLEAESLLKARGISLRALEMQGSRLLLGEGTGGGFQVPASKVDILLLEDQAILRQEVSGMDFSPRTGQVQDLSSFRFEGVFHTGEAIRGVVVR